MGAVCTGSGGFAIPPEYAAELEELFSGRVLGYRTIWHYKWDSGADTIPVLERITSERLDSATGKWVP